MADDYKDAVLLHSPEDNKKIAEVYEEAFPIGGWNYPNSYWADMHPGPFVGDIADKMINTGRTSTSTIPIHACKDLQLDKELLYTRFGRSNPSHFDKNTDMTSDEIVRELLFAFTKWTDIMKGRLPVPDYDIADERIDSKAETEFYNMVVSWLYAAITKDSNAFAQKDAYGCHTFDPVKVNRVCRSLGVVFCAFYHHAFEY